MSLSSICGIDDIYKKLEKSTWRKNIRFCNVILGHPIPFVRIYIFLCLRERLFPSLPLESMEDMQSNWNELQVSPDNKARLIMKRP